MNFKTVESPSRGVAAFGTLGRPKGGAMKITSFLFHFWTIQRIGPMQISNYWDGPGRPGRPGGYATAVIAFASLFATLFEK